MFLNTLDQREVGEAGGRVVFCTNRALIYEDDQYRIEVPEDFFHDQSSVPRVPIVFYLYGDRAHRDGVLHDYNYRRGARVYDKIAKKWFEPTREFADMMFRRSIKSGGYSALVYVGMWAGVRIGGGSSYHAKDVYDCFPLDVVYKEAD
jgi:hypothetical protein